MRHPLEAISPTNRPAILATLLFATLGVSRTMAAPLKTPAAPCGIISLELAGTEEKVNGILSSWDAGQRRAARRNVRLDFAFLLCYSTALGLGCVVASSEVFGPRDGRWKRLGAVLAWLQWVAALLDAAENVALLKILGGRVQWPWPRMARWCAIPKFVLICGGIAYAAVGKVLWLTGYGGDR